MTAKHSPPYKYDKIILIFINNTLGFVIDYLTTLILMRSSQLSQIPSSIINWKCYEEPSREETTQGINEMFLIVK